MGKAEIKQCLNEQSKKTLTGFSNLKKLIANALKGKRN